MNARYTVNTVGRVDAKIQLDITVLQTIVNGSMASRAARFIDWRNAMASREPLEALAGKWEELAAYYTNGDEKRADAWFTCARELRALVASAESISPLEANRRYYERMRPEGISARPDSIPVGSSAELYSTLNRATLMEIVLLRDAKLCAEPALIPDEVALPKHWPDDAEPPASTPARRVFTRWEWATWLMGLLCKPYRANGQQRN